MRLTFLGTGASGGTPGAGRSRRRESSLLIESPASLLIDVTRDFAEQSRALSELDAVLLTHAHRDAIGGMAALRRWSLRRRTEPLAVFGSPQALAVVRDRYRRLDGLELLTVEPGRQERAGGVRFVAIEVPHARQARFRTYAWRVHDGSSTLVYASDVGRLQPALRTFSEGAGVLVVDGAMWRRSLFAHLTIDRELPELCRWRVGRILLTQIGRTAIPHEELERAVADLCPRATPAWDGLTLTV